MNCDVQAAIGDCWGRIGPLIRRYAPDDLSARSVERPDAPVGERRIDAAVNHRRGRNDVGYRPVMPPNLCSASGVDGEHHRTETVHTEIDKAVRHSWRRGREVACESVRRKAPQLLTGVAIQGIELATRSVRGIPDHIDPTIGHTRRRLAAAAYDSAPFDCEVCHVVWGEDRLVGRESGV